MGPGKGQGPCGGGQRRGWCGGRGQGGGQGGGRGRGQGRGLGPGGNPASGPGPGQDTTLASPKSADKADIPTISQVKATTLRSDQT
jgi:hypothetical protein